MTVKLLTRDELANIMHHYGYQFVSKRTIRYWEQEGLLPSAQRHGRKVYHTPDAVDQAAMLSATSPRHIRNVRLNQSKDVSISQSDREIIVKINYR
jgi:DNA-binding transcriptional MerR regulator